MATPREYLYIEQLAELTPWSVEAIKAMLRRGVFQRGVHYFQHGVGTRLIFKWSAIREFIEGHREVAESVVHTRRRPRPGGRRKPIDVEKAVQEAQRLLV